MDQVKNKYNWFYPLLVWLIAIALGSIILTLMMALSSKNPSLRHVYKMIYWILFLATFMSFFSLLLSYGAFIVSFLLKANKLKTRLFTAIPHMLLIVGYGIFIMMAGTTQTLYAGIGYIVAYLTPLIIIMLLLNPIRTSRKVN